MSTSSGVDDEVGIAKRRSPLAHHDLFVSETLNALAFWRKHGRKFRECIDQFPGGTRSESRPGTRCGSKEAGSERASSHDDLVGRLDHDLGGRKLPFFDVDHPVWRGHLS